MIKKEFENIKTIEISGIRTVIIQIHKKDSVIVEIENCCNIDIEKDEEVLTIAHKCASGITAKGDINISFSGNAQIAIGNNIHQSTGNKVKRSKYENKTEVKLYVPMWTEFILDGVGVVRTMFSDAEYVTMDIEG